MTTRLYHHKTDGGAEYLCLMPVEGTDEGDMRTAVIRLDGDPEFTNGMYPHDMYNRIVALEYIRDELLKALNLISVDKDGDGFVCTEAMESVRAAIRKA